MEPTNQILCFICEEDITTKTKVLSYRHFLDWQRAIDLLEKNGILKAEYRDPKLTYKEIVANFDLPHLNGYGAMCSKCAKVDMENTHYRYLEGKKKSDDSTPVSVENKFYFERGPIHPPNERQEPYGHSIELSLLANSQWYRHNAAQKYFVERRGVVLNFYFCERKHLFYLYIRVFGWSKHINFHDKCTNE